MISIWISVIGWLVAGAIGYAVACLMIASAREDECSECKMWERAEKDREVGRVINFLSDEMKKGYVKEQ